MLVSPAGACWVAGACRKPKHEKTPTCGSVLHMVAVSTRHFLAVDHCFHRSAVAKLVKGSVQLSQLAMT